MTCDLHGGAQLSDCLRNFTGSDSNYDTHLFVVVA